METYTVQLRGPLPSPTIILYVCSPIMIQEMKKADLMDGVNVTQKELWEKCKDCILEHQTCWPFDDEAENGLEHLELMAFDFWEVGNHPTCSQWEERPILCPLLTQEPQHGAYLADKSDASIIPAFNTFWAKAESMMGQKIRRLRTDQFQELEGILSST